MKKSITQSKSQAKRIRLSSAKNKKVCSAAGIDEHKIQEAYEEAADHLDMVAGQERDDPEQQTAYEMVSARIRRDAVRSFRNALKQASKRNLKNLDNGIIQALRSNPITLK